MVSCSLLLLQLILCVHFLQQPSHGSPSLLQFVVKRDGRKEPVHFDKITARITKLSYGLNSDFCDPVSILRLPSSFALLIMLRHFLLTTCCVSRGAFMRQIARKFKFQFECQLFVLLPRAVFSPCNLAMCTHRNTLSYSAGYGRPEGHCWCIQGCNHH